MAGSVDELFTKRLPVTLKSPERENRKCSIHVSIELHTSTAPIHRKELVVRLTDEADLFFLYTLRLNEEDFQSLKVQQGLLVDFGAFPQKFVDLLELCIQEEHKDVPKFIIDLVSNGASGACTANMNLIETNPFKHLTHLSLKFLPGTDSDIKKYLADCLKTLKDQNASLLGRLQSTEGDLSGQLRAAREALSARTVELDNLKAEWASRLSDISIQHRQEVTEEREKALKNQSLAHAKFEQEKREQEQSHAKVVRQLEARLADLEQSNKELTDTKYKSESSLRELRNKVSSLEEENMRCKQDLQAIRKNNSSLDNEYHEQEKQLQQLRTRVAVTEQEVKDKQQVLQTTADLLTTEKEQKKKIEEDLERKKRHVGKLEVSIKTMSEELVKGNEIIKKLQGEIRAYHTKLKLRNQVTTEQEKLLTEKNREMETVRRELEQTTTRLRAKDDENKKLNESLEMTMSKLEESRQLLKTNENVITWLNKQVTEQQLAGAGGGLHPPGALARFTPSAAGHYTPTAELNSTTSTGMTNAFRPQSAAHLYNPYGGGSVGGSGGSAAAVAAARLSMSTASQPSTQPQQPRLQQVQYQGSGPGAPSSKSALPVPLAKSSPIGTIPEEERNGASASTASPIHLHAAKNSDLPVTSGGLDLKYLQRGSDHPLRRHGNTSSPPATTSLHFSAPAAARPASAAGQQAAPAAAVTRPGSAGVPYTSARASTTARPGFPPHNTTRLNRDLITGPAKPNQTVPAKSGTPPLASAYFPNQAKVT